MDRTSSFRRPLMRRLFQGAILALPFAALAVAGCSGAVTTGGGGSAGSACSTDNPCPKGAACVFPPGSCQKGAMGVCQSFLQCDGPVWGPVCGCDGKTIEAQYPGCDLGSTSLPYDDNPAACQVGTFPCGPMLQCKRNADVCVETITGMPGTTSYACVNYDKVTRPGWCGNGIPDCACIDILSTPCKADADHEETVTVVMP